jgi:hypothetical protein
MIIIDSLNKKTGVMKKKLVEQKKSLYAWAEEQLFSDEIGPFLQYCRDYFYLPDRLLSLSEFEKLKSGFEY